MTIHTMEAVSVRKCVADIPFVDAKRKDALVEYLKNDLQVDVDKIAEEQLPGLDKQDFTPLFEEAKFSRRDRGVVVTHLIRNIENREFRDEVKQLNIENRQLRDEVKLLNERVVQLSIVQNIQTTVDGNALPEELQYRKNNSQA